jgi:lipid II:glycine glycyltransferase (peptidoglycan interpeptide bridge formation enzyme)
VSVTNWVEESVSAVLCTEPDTATLTAWDDLVAGVCGSDVAQLHAWARVRRMAGFAPLHILAYQGADLVGGAQILRRRLPLLTVGYLPYGPVIAPHAPRPQVCRALGRALECVARNQLRMLFVQPPEGAEDVTVDLLERGFRRSDAGIAPAGSIRVDLSATQAELQSRLTRRLRPWTRNGKWEANGVKVRVGSEADLAVLADLHARTAAHQGFEPFAENYFALLYRELAPNGHATLFVGEVDGVPVASHLYTACGGTMKLRFVGFQRCGTTQRLMVPGAVMWEAIRWAKAHGYRWFDLGGLRETTLRTVLDGNGDRNAVPGPDEYKLRSGGTPFRYPPAVELIRPPALRAGYQLARRTRTGVRLLKAGERLMRGGRAVPSRGR